MLQIHFTIEAKPPTDDGKKAAVRNGTTAGKIPEYDEYYVGYALNFLSSSNTGIRQQWLNVAEAAGAKPPPPKLSKESMEKWVPFIAEELCRERTLADFSPLSRREVRPPLATSPAKEV